MYYWQIINRETGEILEGTKKYKTIGGAFLGAKHHVVRELARFYSLDSTIIDITVFTSKDKAVATTYDFLAVLVFDIKLHIQGEE